MGKRSWLNLVLLFLVVSLAMLVYLEPGKESQQTILLTSLDAEAVQQISVERAEDSVVLQKQSGRWLLQTPVVVPAKLLYVQQLLEILSQQSVQQYPAEGLDLGKYGLQPPQAKLVVDELELAFGRINPLNSRLYVMVDNVIHMVAANDISLLSEPWHGYVSSALFGAGDKLQSLQLPGLGRLDRSDKGWLFDGAIVPDSADQLQAFVDAWTHAQALQVRSMSDTVAPENVVVSLVSGAQISFGLQATEEGLILQRHELGLEYVFDAVQKKRLLQLPQPASEVVYE